MKRFDLKIHCPFHEETTPSCHIYEDAFFCFGCGAKGGLDKLPTDKVEFVRTSNFKNFYKEDVTSRIAYINTLPTKSIRGLILPYDLTGYYLVYPGAQYYIKRVWDTDGGSKYLAPKGTQRPLYKARYGSYEDNKRGPLLVIEGELNAASAAMVLGYTGPIRTVISPGSACELNKPKCIDYCLQYEYICIIVDKDAPGVAAGLQLKYKLIDKGKRVVLWPLEADLNNLLQQDNGQEKVKDEVRRALELL